MSVETTPRPQTKEEVLANVLPERFVNYMLRKESDSMMDHYYDKLLHVAVFEPSVVQNSFLIEEADKRNQPLVDVCIEYGRTGKVPIDLI